MGHHITLKEKIKDLDVRSWYMAQALENGWSRDMLSSVIKGQLFERKGKTINNFAANLPDPQSEMAIQVLKDPYIFDFMTLAEPFNERELETELIIGLYKLCKLFSG